MSSFIDSLHAGMSDAESDDEQAFEADRAQEEEVDGGGDLTFEQLGLGGEDDKDAPGDGDPVKVAPEAHAKPKGPPAAPVDPNSIRTRVEVIYSQQTAPRTSPKGLLDRLRKGLPAPRARANADAAPRKISIHEENRFSRMEMLASDGAHYWEMMEKLQDPGDPDHRKVKKGLEVVGYLNNWHRNAPRPPTRMRYAEGPAGDAKYEEAKERYRARLPKHESNRQEAENWLEKNFPDNGQYALEMRTKRISLGVEQASYQSRHMFLAKKYGEPTDIQRVEARERQQAEEAAKKKLIPAKGSAAWQRSLDARTRVLQACMPRAMPPAEAERVRQNHFKSARHLLNDEDRQARDAKRAEDALATGAGKKNNEYNEMIARLEQREADFLASEQAFKDNARAHVVELRIKKDKRDREALDRAERRDARTDEFASARFFSSKRFVLDAETGKRLDGLSLLDRYGKAKSREYQAAKRRKEARDVFYTTYVDHLADFELGIAVDNACIMSIRWESPSDAEGMPEPEQAEAALVDNRVLKN